VAREFVVREGCEQDFSLIFGPDGIWCDLLRSCSKGFKATELIAVAPLRYRVRDYWTSHREFEVFRARHQYDVEKFRDWFASKELAEQETFLGSFYQDPEGSEDAGQVSV
jgi:hypothetical protein